MSRDIKGDVAVITGGGSPNGIGAATGKLLAQRGAKVVLTDINGESLDATVQALVAEGLDVSGEVADVSNWDSVKKLADTVFDRHGKVDIVYLNAGIGGGGSYFDDDLSAWNTVFGINFFGVLHGIKAFVPRMMKQGTPGDVLAATSGAGAVGVMYETPGYAASKAAVLTLFEGLYAKLRDANSQIRAHAVFPPLTRTNLAGNPEIMDLVHQNLTATGVVAVLAEPAEVAVTVLESIESGSFWAYHDHEADNRLYDGKFKADIDWQESILRSRAESLINRTPPDPYLWGKFS